MNDLVEVKQLLRESLMELNKSPYGEENIKAVQKMEATLGMGSKSNIFQVQILNINNTLVINNIDKVLSILDNYSVIDLIEREQEGKKIFMKEGIFDLNKTVQKYKTEVITKALEICSGNIAAASRLLNIKRTTLNELVYRYGIKRRNMELFDVNKEEKEKSIE